MTAEPLSLKTDAERQLVENYRAVRDTLPGSEAIAKKRDAAIAVFDRLGLPHRRVEAWKYTDLRALQRTLQPIAPKPSLGAVEATLATNVTHTGLDRYRLIIADGHYQDALSDREPLLREGVDVTSLSEFLALDHGTVDTVLRAPDGAGEDAMIALNTAFASDGVVVSVPEGCVASKPIEIVHVTSDGKAAAWFSRSAVRLSPRAVATVLVSHIGPDGTPYQSNSYVGVDLSEGADAAIVDLQAEGNQAQHVATFAVQLAPRSNLRHLCVATGAAASRLQSFAAIDGEGTNLSVAGANMLSGSQHGDIAWNIDHRAPGSKSRVLFKNAATDAAFGAFQGLILVRPNAQKTDGKMMTRTLLLSNEAQFAAKPELEIYADDVQCGHGATIGKTDLEAMFYLRSRGIPEAEAESLLVRAFLAEAVEVLGDDRIAASLEPVLSAWLERRSR